MIIALQRVIGTTSISMIVDEDWDVIKHKMCEKWSIEKPFNEHFGWDRLRNGAIITFCGALYQVWDCSRSGEYADELFQGRHIEIIDTEAEE